LDHSPDRGLRLQSPEAQGQWDFSQRQLSFREHADDITFLTQVGGWERR
jgi:hypothetical protein